MQALKRLFVFSMLFLMAASFFPPSSFAATAGVTAPSQTVADPLPPKSGQIELVSKRTANTKTFLNSKGQKQLRIYENPVHYQTEVNGQKQWEEIDSGINDKGFLGLPSSNYTNNKNNFQLSFPKNVNGKLYSIKKDGSEVSLSVDQQTTTSKRNRFASATDLGKVQYQNKDNKILYYNIAPGADVKLFSIPEGVQQDILLYSYNGQNTFSFNLNLSNTYYEKQSDGTFKFYNSQTKAEVFTLPKLLMWDDKGGHESPQNVYSNNLSADIVKTNSGFKYVVTADDQWLSSKDRVFPITIDPTINTYNAYNASEDTYVQSWYPTTLAYNQRALWVGNDTNVLAKGVERAYVNLGIPDLSGARITGASLQVYQYANCYGSCTWSGISAYMTYGYNPWALVWNNQPGWVSQQGSSGVNATTGGWLGMDVTGAVQHWVQAGNPSGSMLGSFAIASDAEGYAGTRSLSSKDNPDIGSWAAPYLAINYIDYNASYCYVDKLSPSTCNNGASLQMFAGTSSDVPITVQNTGRNTWTTDAYKLSYHWVNNATGQEIVHDGIYNSLPRNINPKGDSATVLASVKAPTVAGSYTLKWDMIQPGVTWFSDQWIGTLNQQVTVTTPSFDSMTHLGSAGYGTLSGPVDTATGNLVSTAVDSSVSSNGLTLPVGRNYNSAAQIPTFSQDANGYIRTWDFNGPYSEPDQSTRLSKKFIANESSVRPSPGSSSNGNIWLAASEPNTSQMWLNYVFSALGAYQLDWAQNVTAYANVYVYSPTTRATQIRVGSDDGLELWVNGNQVIYDDVARGLTLDQDIVNVNLNQGWNRVLAKVAQGVGGWQLAARFTDQNGAIFNDLQYSVNNPDIYADQNLIGNGWSSTLSEKLYLSDSQNIYYRDSSGAVTIFTQNSDGTYQPPAGYTTKLAHPGNYYTLTSKTGMITYFDWVGRKLAIQDLNGNWVSYVIDNSARVIKIIDAKYYNFDPAALSIISNPSVAYSRNLNISYNPNGQISTVSDQLGEATTYGYDLYGRLGSVTDPGGNIAYYTYNSDGKLATIKDKAGNVTSINYSGGKVSQLIDALGGTTTYTYNGSEATVTDSLGNSSVNRIADAKLVSMGTNAKGYAEKYVYDANYNVIRTYPGVDSGNPYYYSWYMSYDANRNILSKTDPQGLVTKYTYTAAGDVATVTNPKGAVEKYVYDSTGRRLVLSHTLADGTVTYYAYDNYGRIASSINANGGVSRYTYDSAGDVITSYSPKLEKTTYTYDAIGRQISEVTPLGNSLTYTYDKLSRVMAVNNSGGIKISYSYDANGNKLTETDPMGGIQKKQYDQLNHLVKFTDAAGISSAYTYDKDGNLLTVTDAKGNVTKYNYDSLNQVQSQTNADGNTVQLTYDQNGNLTASTDANGTQTSSSYNSDGQLVNQTKAGETKTLGYDSGGMLTSVSDAGQTTNLALNIKNQVTQESNSNQGTTNFTYDANGNVITAAAKTSTVSFAYDADNQASAVVSSLTTNGATIDKGNIAVDSEGKVTQIKKGNGDIVSMAYDKSGRLISLTSQNASGVIYAKYNYTYDANSNRTSVTDKNGLVKKYTYDNRNQLSKDDIASYSYDAMGNRTNMVTAAGTTQYSYATTGDSNKLNQVTYPDGRTVSYSYDNNGNIVKATDSKNGITTYAYDVDNYFTKATMPNGETIEYLYDKTNKRRIQRNDTLPSGVVTTTKYVYDGDKLVSETDAAGNVQTSYTWDENETLISVTIKNNAGTLDTYQYIKNARGDVIGLSDKSGNQVVAYDYDSWGNIISSTTLPGASTNYSKPLNQMNVRLYASYWYDQSLSLYFMKTRMYNPVLGRFMSKDQISLASATSPLAMNQYLYTENNPINRVDPTGKAWWNDWNDFTKAVSKVVSTIVNVVKAVANWVNTYIVQPVVKTVTSWISGITGSGKSSGGGGGGGGGGPGSAYKQSEAAHSIANQLKAGGLIGNLITGSSSASIGSSVATQAARTYSVYQGTDPLTGLTYVGRTVDFSRRAAEWSNDTGMQVRLVYDNLSYQASRGIEQIKILENGGIEDMANKINGISESNPNAVEYLQAGYDTMVENGEEISPEVLETLATIGVILLF